MPSEFKALNEASAMAHEYLTGNKKYKKPDGSMTHDVDEYVESWLSIGEPVAEFMGCRVSGFGPDFQFVSNDGEQRTFSMPVWAVQEFNRKFEEISCSKK